jgi:PAS domain S-box-containing protein
VVNQNRLSQQIELVQHQLAILLGADDLPAADRFRDALTQLLQTITTLEQQQTEPTSRSQDYQDLFEFAPDGYVVTDDRGCILAANQVATALLDCSFSWSQSSDALVGQSFSSLLTADTSTILSEMLLAFERGAATQVQEVCLQRHPEPLCVVLRGTAQRQGDRVTRLRWILHDISDRKQAEQQLQLRIEQGQLMGAIASRIRLSLNPQEILNSAADEVRRFLQTDRVVVYRLEPNQGVTIVAEAVSSPWRSILG